MTRAQFFATFAAIPFVGKLFKPKVDPFYNEPAIIHVNPKHLIMSYRDGNKFIKTVTHDGGETWEESK